MIFIIIYKYYKIFLIIFINAFFLKKKMEIFMKNNYSNNKENNKLISNYNILNNHLIYCKIIIIA